MTDQGSPGAEDDDTPAPPEADTSPGIAGASSQGTDRTEASDGEVTEGSTDLRTKPILEWTKDDWRRWVEGSSDLTASASRGNGGTGADPSGGATELPVVPVSVAPKPEEAVATEPAVPAEGPEPGAGDDVVATAPVHEEVSAPPGPIPEAEAEAAAETETEKALAPEPVTEAKAVETETETPPTPAAPPSGSAREPGLVQRVVRQPRIRPQARSALGLMALCVVVGVVLAGLVTVALVVAALALQSAVG